ncbi:hypothetical protein KZZ52_21515 [Dactylosporangium sp. AC04546]|uniref:hypothetical protein n=1 Tax=Dactylosporangium sp. AC04546 TaxID=2862460 RepID=UPI001EDE7278|nr:hypothetical protein [Dactylosporangium sp. AC04546]WVK87860.1 hypothetical protein KZZ52_21515 [Dactylosporangium sp. AC04546]
MTLAGYTVEATDGAVGRAGYEGRQVVVTDGHGDRLRLDVNTVARIDHRTHRVYLGVSRGELRPANRR